ncbi:hypothetical protein HK414_15995 [Ramlibacter terrae]|uniref:Uncharacterized protein n=1 Tax=Ramlibacter terrae TaxID=2732511 RepID=A0ABX6P6N8_9BURK|nr:hypothetical protein HK414_15995 [Ramlibacter terrae]
MLAVSAEAVLPEVSSSGDITLDSTEGRIVESFLDDGVDLVADVLTLRAKSGITGLEIAVNSLDAATDGGDIVLSERDGLKEKSLGLDVLAAQTSLASGTTLVSITAANDLRVGDEDRVAAQNAITGNTIRPESTLASVLVTASATGDTLGYDKGVAFVAKDVVSLYRFFDAEDLMEYRAGNYFLFNNASRLFPSDMSAKTLIIETGGTLSLRGVTLQASERRNSWPART